MTDRSDAEIQQATLEAFRRKCDQDSPIYGCRCHPLSAKQIVEYLERAMRGERIDLDPHRGATMYALTSPAVMRRRARECGIDPLDLLKTK